MSTLDITIHFSSAEGGDKFAYSVAADDLHRQLFECAGIGTDILFNDKGKRYYGTVTKKTIFQGAQRDWSLEITVVGHPK
ncbi:hypothetical protein [Pseudomonas sp. McL0111]|uniref:hypothetical protein n=1 Tax=Pseudomonas sp. McL0111 TaxID=3457357 RepID=UPI00403EB6E7